MSLTTSYRPPFAGGLRRLAKKSPLAGLSIGGLTFGERSPSRLLGTPPELMLGDAATGQGAYSHPPVAALRHFLSITD
ncbi:MAG: hypothetical protein QGG84_05400 [Rhodospirillales bacterium]|nr:hypothetical protein [Rhodospirillales bacterium]